ncbi:MAG: alanine racemase, partial [Chlamydiia bacterium]|nr:alanine racemase [Chlamydiia bacterium]
MKKTETTASSLSQPRKSASHPCRLEIKAEAIAHNLALLKGKKEALCMVKADAYGLGIETVAPLLYDLGVRFFGVAFLEEALALKPYIRDGQILLLFTRPEDAPLTAEMGLHVAVDDLATLRALEAQKKPCKVHLHLNTGMNRLGCSPSEFAPLVDKVRTSSTLQLEGLMTHLPCAEDKALSRLQMLLFHEQIRGLKARYIHAANSAAALNGIDTGCNLVRIGLGLYGIHPPLQHALALESEIVKIHEVSAGEGVSYGHRFVAKRASRVAVIPFGYADGMPWAASERMQVRIEEMLL